MTGRRKKLEKPEIKRHQFEFSPARSSHFASINFGNDDLNIPLHVSLRPTRNEIVVNALSDGVWQQECVKSFEYDPAGTHIVDVRIGDSYASILIDDVPLFVKQPIAFVDTIKNVVSGLAPYEKAPELLHDPIRIAGMSFDFEALFRGGRRYIREVLIPFLSSHVVGPKDGMFLDLSETEGAVATILHTLYPSALVVAVADEDARANLQIAGVQAPGRVIALTADEALAAFSQASDINTVSEAEDSPGEIIAQFLRNNQFAAVFARDVFSHPEDALFKEMEPFLARGPVAVCASEEDLKKTMKVGALLQGPRDLMINFVGQPWLWRKDRLGLANQRIDRLDIGVAMYNTGRFITPCIESLLGEARDDIRVILVNDGSTDDSLEVVERNFRGHPRLEIVTKANGGCASARNYGRLVSDAQYITFVDADDFVDPHMFPSLLDLARVSGNEIVQGGFVFHESETGENKPSYELEQFKDWARMPFKDASCFRVHAQQLIAGQPTIWRRVYRRDFLDNKNLWFPEHIRAFDDMIFHLMSVYLARDVLTLDGANYYYRQHAAQDIKQGDERHFYELEMYRILAKRAIREGWNDFQLFTPGIVNTINWSVEGVREDLVLPFLNGAAELWVLFERAFGRHAFPHAEAGRVRHSDFLPFVERERSKLARSNLGYAAALIDGMLKHPGTLSMGRRMRQALTG